MLTYALVLTIAATALGPRPAPPPQQPPGLTYLIPAGATWRYDDSNTNLTTAGWEQPSYDDSAWASGPAQLGFGDGDEATVVNGGPANQRYPTIYFRHQFQLGGGQLPQVARIRVLFDDAAVLYLNGTEIGRVNISNGWAGHNALAASTISGAAESAWRVLSVPASSFQPGTNVMAVAIHQSSPSSSDLSFDLELTAGLAPTPTITRGPYLQNGTPSGATIRWRTDQPTESWVWLGSTPSSLAPAAQRPQLTTEHSVSLTGLQPETSYFYAVGDATGPLSGPGPDHVLTTLPPSGSVRPMRLWVLGDAGTASWEQLAVRDHALAAMAGTDPDAVLFLGDDAYRNGTQNDYRSGLFDIYGDVLRRTFSWSTYGNHDDRSANAQLQTGPYFEVFDLPANAEAGGVPSGTEAYYSFDRGHVHFVCIDSQASNRSTGGAMMTWLSADLAATTARWLIAFFHHPVYSAGSHPSDDPLESGGRSFDMRQVALPLLEAAGVDLVLTGHSHSYERTHLLDGHYGTSSTLQPSMVLDLGDGAAAGDGIYAKPTAGLAPHEGAVYVVAGTAGKTEPGTLDHPAMVRSLEELGSLVVDIDGDRLHARFVGVTGILDEFTIEKGLTRTLRRDQPSISLSGGGRQDLHLRAGPQHSGEAYVLGGAFTAATGFDVGGVHVPLDPDAWLGLSLQFANSAVYPNSAGVLDAQGASDAALVLPPLLPPGMLGQHVLHAYVTFVPGQITHASNTVKVTFGP